MLGRTDNTDPAPEAPAAPEGDKHLRQRSAQTTGVHLRAVNDYVIVGGGLQGGLLALAILDAQPDATLTLVEREPQLGGNHTWCFHEADVDAAAWNWLSPLVVKSWPEHEVRFVRHQRVLHSGYCAITSKRLQSVVQRRIEAAPNASIEYRAATHVERRGVVLTNGTELRGQLVIDCRGPTRALHASRHYQKFIGLELLIDAGSGPARPTLMDATVPQEDGFRFMYVLPFSDDRVLVEDTYYSSNVDLDEARLASGIIDYAKARGMRVRGVIRRERGVLPLPTTPLKGASSRSPLVAGYAGGFFHPTTGYSLPVALRLASQIAGTTAERALGDDFERFVHQHASQVRYCCWLNRLLFGGFEERDRFNVLERFYRLPQSTIQRFYALQLTQRDKARILCGRPPRGFSPVRFMKEGLNV